MLAFSTALLTLLGQARPWWRGRRRASVAAVKSLQSLRRPAALSR